MPKPKWNLNTIYISERLQESLRPISRCAMTTVVAPMGYGKTTAVNWYLGERAKAETLKIIRISIFCGNTPAPRTQRAADCWWMTSAMCWREKHPATSSLTISTC